MNKKTCAGALITSDGKFLFGKRSTTAKWYAGVWDIVGGHSIGEETAEETMKRELNEELSIDPTKYVELARAEIRENSVLVTYIVFVVTDWLGRVTNVSGEHSEIRWFTREELSSLELASEKYLLLIDQWVASRG